MKKMLLLIIIKFLFFAMERGFWCMDDHVCNVLYNVNRLLCKKKKKMIMLHSVKGLE